MKILQQRTISKDVPIDFAIANDIYRGFCRYKFLDISYEGYLIH